MKCAGPHSGQIQPAAKLARWRFTDELKNDPNCSTEATQSKKCKVPKWSGHSVEINPNWACLSFIDDKNAGRRAATWRECCKSLAKHFMGGNLTFGHVSALEISGSH